MKVNILSTRPETCGIGITNQYTVDGMKPHIKHRNVQIKQIFIDKPFSMNTFYFVKKAWETGKDCDIIHVHYNHDCFGKIFNIYGYQNFFVYLILSLFKRPIITTFHEQPDLKNASKLRKAFYQVINWAPLKMSQRIVVTTAKTEEHIKQFIPGKPITVLPLGAFQHVKMVNKDFAKDKLGLKNKKVLTLFGFIDNNKGHHLILDVLRDLPDKYHFLIAGDSRSEKGEKYKRKLVDIINDYRLQERVTFLGYVKKRNFPVVMAASDLMVYPYDNITSSLALTTAISYKKQILASDILPFTIFKKEHGCIQAFKLGDRNSLLHQIKYTLNSHNLRKRRKKEMDHFIQEYNWDTIGLVQLAIYHMALPGMVYIS